MKSALTIAGVLLASLFLSPVAHAQKIKVGYDKAVNFANYKTFMFSAENGARNPFVNTMIMDALVRELTAKGLTRVDANPDLRVMYLAATGFNVQVASVPFYTVVNPTYSGMGIGGSTTAMWDVTTGTLLIDLYDNKTDRVIFSRDGQGRAATCAQRRCVCRRQDRFEASEQWHHQDFQEVPWGRQIEADTSGV